MALTTAHFSAAERKITVAGVMIVFLLSALDQTIVATAMPRIIAELHGLALYSWVTTSYLLTSTVIVPICGKLGDLYGRKPVLLVSIGLFLAGSWLCGLSGELGDLPLLGGGMTQLIAFRAVQGLGGGGLFTTAFAIIGELYPPRERGKIGGLFGAVFGLSSTIGPLVGGYFTDHGTVTLFGHVIAGWRWVFYLNLPLGLLALFMVIAKMPKMSHQAKGRIDFIGAFLIVVSIVPLLLALTFGGHFYPWDSVQVLGLFAIFVVGTILYIVNERYASHPILPLSLFDNRVFRSAIIASFLISMSFMSAALFLPLFMQIGQSVDATVSGLTMLPLMAGLIGGSIVAGRLVSKTGTYKPLMLGGIAISFLGIFLLSRMDAHTSRLDLAWRMLVLGIGLGPGQSVFNIAIQNALPMEQLGVATSASQFFRQIGSTIGVAVFGTILTNELSDSLGETMPGMNLDKLHGMAATSVSLPDSIREAITGTITYTFALSLLVVAMSFVATLFVPHLPLKPRMPVVKPEPQPEPHL